MTVTLVSALLHECVHLVFVIGCGCTDISLTLLPGGASLGCAGLETAGLANRLLVLLSAPLCNLTIGAALFALSYVPGVPDMKNAAVINICLGAANLLPVPFLDGGRALNAVLSVKYGEKTVGEKIEAAGAVTLLLLAAVALTLAFSGKDPIGAAVFTGYCAIFGFAKRNKRKS